MSKQRELWSSDERDAFVSGFIAKYRGHQDKRETIAISQDSPESVQEVGKEEIQEEEKVLNIGFSPEFEKQIAAGLDTRTDKGKVKSHLAPVKYKNKDFFIADMFDAVPKDDISSMEHPVFALKPKDTRDRHYEHNGNELEIKSTSAGIATIHDKDVWIFCFSQLMSALNKGEEISNRVRFVAHDFFVNTNRRADGKAYKRLEDGLERLQGTVIKTTIRSGGYTAEEGFGLIDGYRFVRKDNKEDGRLIAIEVVMPEWAMESIYQKKLLTINKDYFRITRAIDRRIYELVRKHCGSQSRWKISLKLLKKKTGSTVALKRFRQIIRSLAISNDLPDYQMFFEKERDILTFYPKSVPGVLAMAKDGLKAD